MDYKGMKCPVCEKLFTETDDIVVCPVCGAPYHRACYAEKGECIFTDLHDKGEAWAPPAPPTPPDVTSEIKDRECPTCGTLNAHSSLFCSLCGSSLAGEPDEHRNSAYTHPTGTPGPSASYNTQSGFSEGPMPMGGAFRGFPGMAYPFDPMGGTNPLENMADGVTYGDVSKVVQQNSGYYLAVFKNTKDFNRSKFNFSAFFFSGGWLLYRKQYKTGILVTALMFLLYIANSLLQSFVSMPMLVSICDSYGLDYGQITNTQLYTTLNTYFIENPNDMLIFSLPLLCYALMFAVMLIVGFRANRIYMKHCIRTVRDIKRTSSTESDLSMAYTARGGVNPAVALCLMICYFIVSWIPLFMNF